ncbi:MAG: hypothetical protein RL385_4733 [Pseudomonadota bacterium]|jgi:flagellar biosynthetic protein FliQ
MNLSHALDWYRQMIWTAVLVGGPVMLASVVVGLVMAIFQAATQINDAAIAFAPKALVMTGVLVVAGPWMMAELLDFTRAIFEALASLHP